MHPALHDFVLQVADCLRSGLSEVEIYDKLKNRLDFNSFKLLIVQARKILSVENDSALVVPAVTAASIGAFREEALSESDVNGAVFENGDDYE